MQLQQTSKTAEGIKMGANTNENVTPLPLVTEQDLINTYSKEEQLSSQKYAEYLELIKMNPTMGYKKAAKLLEIKSGQTRWWHTKGEKKAIPLPLKVTEKLKNAGLIPFYETNPSSPIIFNMLGTLFGDGGIDVRLNTVAFISSDKKEVDLWLNDLTTIFPFAKESINIIEGGEYGHSYNGRCFDRAVIRFFAALGAPVGDKVTISYTLPKWISSIVEKSRTSFLDGYLASEISVVQWRSDLFGNYRFNNFSLGVSKIEELENEHRSFLQNVEKLLESVGIATTKNIHKNYSAGRARKDGLITANYRIFIRTTFDRVLFFNEKFELRYAKGKKERFNAVIKQAIEEKNHKRSQTK